MRIEAKLWPEVSQKFNRELQGLHATQRFAGKIVSNVLCKGLAHQLVLLLYRQGLWNLPAKIWHLQSLCHG